MGNEQLYLIKDGVDGEKYRLINSRGGIGMFENIKTGGEIICHSSEVIAVVN